MFLWGHRPPTVITNGTSSFFFYFLRFHVTLNTARARVCTRGIEINAATAFFFFPPTPCSVRLSKYVYVYACRSIVKQYLSSRPFNTFRTYPYVFRDEPLRILEISIIYPLVPLLVPHWRVTYLQSPTSANLLGVFVLCVFSFLAIACFNYAREG